MGYMKVIALLNDAEDSVTEDPAGWWEACRQAFWRLRDKKRGKNNERETEQFGHASYANYWTAVWEEHADITAVIMVGQNHATVIGSSLYSHHHEEDGQIKILKDILDRKGYRIVKKSARNRISSS